MGALNVMGVIITSWIILCSMACIGIATVQARSFRDDVIEAHLNRLNKKPFVKSVKLKDGDVIDCVDIYKQLAFDHPLLKNHEIQMLPNFILETNKSNEKHMQPLWKESEGCPYGTIPIRRVQKNNIVRASSMGGFGKRNTNGGQVESAGMLLKDGGPYHGAKAYINVWEPMVEKNEWSHSNIEISDGANPKQNIIEGGWLVNHQLFGDGKTRLYTYWTADGYQDTGCYNIYCPGFVQVTKKYVLGVQLQPVSMPEGNQYYLPTTIRKDSSNNWWLSVIDEPIGYWPQELFSNKFKEAYTIRWAGGVLNLNSGGKHTISQMGSGMHAGRGWGFAAFFNAFFIVDKENNLKPPGAELVKSFADNDHCYDAILENKEKHILYYGGNCI